MRRDRIPLNSLLDARTILLIAPAIVLLALWGQSYLGGFRSYYLGFSDGGWFTFVFGGGHGGFAISVPYWLATLPALALALLGLRSATRRIRTSRAGVSTVE